ncbi:MAG: glutamate-5-semialdehyde dehydrogenase [Ruminococcaceae bacterium]|nr:glutamate-5-semialdehyde dehydrogenase [Oscillospiraceae bacterium]
MEFTKEIYEYIEQLCKTVKSAERSMADSTLPQRNNVLKTIAAKLIEKQDEILKANAIDVASAEQNGVIPTMVDRLTLNESRIKGISDAMLELVGLKDVLGCGDVWTIPNGIEIKRVRVPLGVVAIIYEARPNVTVDAAALCIKTGNAVILRGGKEAVNTNRVFVSLMKEALEANGISPDALGFVDNTSREGASVLMTMRDYIDVLIPRGGAGLIRNVVENAKMPVIETGAGNCHLYVDKDADIDMAVKVASNAKNQRPSVCNAIETLLVHNDKAEEFLPKFAEISEQFGLEIRGCERTMKILDSAKAATEEDYATEYDDYIIAVKVVDGVEEAVSHINKYNTKHSEAIITNNISAAEYFQKTVDAAAVYVNTSTRFTDGNEFGFGAEIGISTQKLHARGPMGLEALTTVKYLVSGNGQIR